MQGYTDTKFDWSKQIMYAYVAHKNRFLLLVFLLTLAVSIAAVWYSQPHKVGAEASCPPDWYKPTTPADVRSRCAEVKGVQVQQKATQEMAQKALETPVPEIIAESRTPLPKLPKPTGPYSGAREIPLDKLQDSSMQGATSVWQMDYVPNADQTLWAPVFIVAYGDRYVSTRFERRAYNAFSTNGFADYHQIWRAPHDIGPVTITLVTGGINGIVTFKSVSGPSSTLNIANQLWSTLPK